MDDNGELIREDAGIDNPRIRLQITDQLQAPNLTWLIHIPSATKCIRKQTASSGFRLMHVGLCHCRVSVR